MPEEWRDIPGYEGLYAVSNKGSVKSLSKIKTSYGNRTFVTKDKVLKSFEDKKGYLMVKLYKEGTKATRKVHRLVASAFIEKVPGKEQINHIDGNKQNNTVGNLEWADNSDNQLHSFRVLGKQATWKGKKLPKETCLKISRHWLEHGGVNGKAVRCIETGEEFINACAASRSTGIHRTNIGRSCRTGCSAKGTHWCFV